LFNKLGKIESCGSISNLTKSLTNEIKAATYCFGANKTPKAWWNDELKQLFKEFSDSQSKACRDPSYENYVNAVNLKIKWKKSVKIAKKTSF